MIKLADDRGSLFQWDTGRQVECDAEQVHFSNHHYGTSVDVDVQDGKATIPNQLLTSATPLKAWAWVTDDSGEYTKEEQIFIVAKRNKPSDYVYTPTEIKTWQDLQNQIDILAPESHTHDNKSILDKFGETDGQPTYNGEPIGGGSVGDITAEDVTYTNPNESWANAKQALDGLTDYLVDYGGAIDDLAQSAHTHDNKSVLDKLSVAGGKLQYDGSDVGLKGDKGDKGEPGADGYTPVKGTDYWTAADKEEIVDDVLAALPTWTGGSY